MPGVSLGVVSLPARSASPFIYRSVQQSFSPIAAQAPRAECPLS